MNLLKENFFKKVLTNKEKCDIIYIVKGKEIPYRKELIKMTGTLTTHTNEFLKTLCDLQTEWKAEVDRLSLLLSKLNKQQEEILHLIELETLNAPQKAKAMKKLTEVRKERREVHQKINDLNAALASIKFKHFSQPKHTFDLSYEYSEEIVSAVYGEDGE